MDDYGTQDTSNVGDNYETNSYNYSDGNYQGYTHHYDIDKSNDFSPTQEHKYSGSLDHNNTGTSNTYASSNNDSDFAETAKHSLSPESQELTPQSETENYKWLEEQENFHSEMINPRDEYQAIINQEPKANEAKFMNDNMENTDDSDCCYCKSEPLMCLAIFCECLCL